MSREQASRYASAYLQDRGFEDVMVRYRQRLLLERLALHRPRVVVEVGCGAELLYAAWRERGGTCDRWIIVEPGDQFAAVARQADLPDLHVVNDYLEHAVAAVRALAPSPIDMIICSSVLHEVVSPPDLLAAIRDLMSEQTLLHLNVPNAESFHRRLARAMGLIRDTKAMSDRNRYLFQHRIYDLPTLRAALTSADLHLVDEGGYLVKPFTHQQMLQITPAIGDPVLDGLFELGREMPELASEIFVEARKAKDGG